MALAGALLPALGAATSARADGLVEYVPPSSDPNNPGDYWLVNGTAANDLIVLTSLSDGTLGVVRLTGLDVEVGAIAAGDAATHVVVVSAGDGNDVINAWSAGDNLALEIHGGAGDDTIVGSRGFDFLLGEAGNDVVYGGPGLSFDVILGGAGYGDQLYAGAGGSSIGDDDGVAIAQGGDGDDTISVNYDAGWVNPGGERAADSLVGGGGNDEFHIRIVAPTVGPTPPLYLSVDGEGLGTETPGVINTLEILSSQDPHTLLDPASPVLTTDPATLNFFQIMFVTEQ
jgi:Ca2+-binding RTX toxin-like protein